MSELFETEEDQPLVIPSSQLLENDFHPDRQAIELEAIVASSGVDTSTDLSGNQIVTPHQDFYGEAWFDYQIADTSSRTDEARVSVTVTSINDAPS